MKNIFNIFLFLLLPVIFVYGQQDLSTTQKLLSFKNDKRMFFDIRQTSLQDPFKICQDIYEWDQSINNFVRNGTLEIACQRENDQDVYTIEGEIDSGEGIEKLRVISYGGFNDIFSGEDFEAESGDSTFAFIYTPEMEFVPLLKIYNTFEDGKIQMSQQYLNFSLIGIPLGFVLTGIVTYHYNESGTLVNKKSNSLDFFSGEMSLVDSLVFRYNGLGQLGEERLFSADDAGTLFLAEKKSHTYNPAGMKDVTTLEEYDPSGVEFYRERTSYSYDIQGRQTGLITEVFDLENELWAFDFKVSNLFEFELPLGFPTRQLFQLHDGSKWVNSDLITNKDCSATYALETAVPEVHAWMNAGHLYLKGIERFSNFSHLSIFHLSGAKAYRHSGKLRDRYDLSGVMPGIYILEVKDENSRVTKKLLIMH